MVIRPNFLKLVIFSFFLSPLLGCLVLSFFDKVDLEVGVLVLFPWSSGLWMTHWHFPFLVFLASPVFLVVVELVSHP